MSKKTTTPTTELVPAGEFSKSVELSFKALGEKVTEKMVAEEYQLAHDGIATGTLHGILTGALLEFKKAALPHGKFGAFCKSALESANTQRVAYLKGESIRSAQIYRQLFRRILGQILHPDIRNPIGQRILALQKANESPAADIVPQLMIVRDKAVVDFIAKIIGEMSLRDLMRNLNESAKVADEEEAASQERPTKTRAEAQTEFFDILLSDLKTIEDRMEAPEFLTLDRREIKGYATKLIEQGKKILAMLDEGTPTPGA